MLILSMNLMFLVMSINFNPFILCCCFCCVVLCSTQFDNGGNKRIIAFIIISFNIGGVRRLQFYAYHTTIILLRTFYTNVHKLVVMNWTVGRSKQKNTTHEEDDDDDDGGDQVSPLILPTSLNESEHCSSRTTADSRERTLPFSNPNSKHTDNWRC